MKLNLKKIRPLKKKKLLNKEKIKKQSQNKRRKNSLFEYLGQTTSPLDNVGLSSAIDRTASDYTDAGEKV